MKGWSRSFFATGNNVSYTGSNVFPHLAACCAFFVGEDAVCACVGHSLEDIAYLLTDFSQPLERFAVFSLLVHCFLGCNKCIRSKLDQHPYCCVDQDFLHA